MPNQIPKISVILCIYNGEALVERAIRSILNQTFPDFELIVIDDGSNDKTVEIVSKLQQDDRRIVLKSIAQSGLTKALNVGLKMAAGKYVARMDVDDDALPGRFQQQVEFLDKNPTVGVVGTAYIVAPSNEQSRKPHVPLLEGSKEIKRALPKFNPFCHGTTMMRKSLLEQIGGYDESFVLAQDYDLWFRLSKITEFANLSDVESLMNRYEDEKTIIKERRQNLYGIKARLKAIRQRNSSVFNIIYIVRPFLVVITPIWLKQLIRKLIHAKN